MPKDKNQVSLILVDKNHNLVLQLRDNISNIGYPNCVGTFGGAIEEGETPEQAIVREIKEELDYELKNPLFISKFTFENYNIFVFLKEDKGLDYNQLEIYEGQKIIAINSENPNLDKYNFAFNTRELIEYSLEHINLLKPSLLD